MWTLILALLLSSTKVDSLFHIEKLSGRREPRRVNTDYQLSAQCNAALQPNFQYKQWNKAREAIGMQDFIMDKSNYFRNTKKIRTFYSFGAGISLFNISNVLVPYLLIWKAGNDAIRGNLLAEERRLAPNSKSPEMHVFDSPAGVNREPYLSALKKHTSRKMKTILYPPAFTFVREPISHFVSGLNEYYFRCSPKKNVTADEIRKEIRDLLDFKALFREVDSCDKINIYSVRHVYPMSGILINYGKDVYNLNFIGKLEHFDEDWAKINDIYQMNLTFNHRIGRHPSSQDNSNVHKEFNTLFKSQPASNLAYIRALCHLLLVDFICFNYSLPPVCNIS